jgi:predicted PurR-regulated permease PerM
MSDDHPAPGRVTLRRVLLALLLGALVFVCAVLLQPMLVPAVWAAILAYASWPLYHRLRRPFGRRHTLAALAMTLLAGVVLVVPMFWLGILLEEELARAYQAIVAYRPGEPGPMSEVLRAAPWLSAWLQAAADRMAGNPAMFRDTLVDWAQHSRAELLGVIGGVGRNVARLFLTLLTVFFLYRDGEALLAQATRIVHRFFGDELNRHIGAAARTTRAVVYGLLIAALVQGIVGGIGYAIFGVGAPVLLGGLTALSSIVPIVGTVLVWGSVGAWLMLTGHLWPGIGLLLWGALLVYPADNVIRPLLISSATQIPFLLVMFGVIGGLAAFGLMGLFIGPVVLAIATALWREWAEPDTTS